MYGIHDGTYNTTEGPGLGREPLLLLLALNGLKFHRNKSSAFRRKFNAYSNNLKTFFKITQVNLLSSGILFMLNGRREGERRDGGSFWAAPAPSGHHVKGSTHYLTILQIFTARFILQISKQFQEFPCLPQAAKLKSGREDTQKGYLHISATCWTSLNTGCTSYQGCGHSRSSHTQRSTCRVLTLTTGGELFKSGTERAQITEKTLV